MEPRCSEIPIDHRPNGARGRGILGQKLRRHLVAFTFVSLALAACSNATPAASSCSELASTISEEVASLSDGSDQARVDMIWEAAAETATDILEANPEDPDADSCRRIVRAVRDNEANKFLGE